jgi:hypothetical protein
MNLGTHEERARRFPLHLCVRYGRFREGTHLDAVTVDVSRTGVLFTTRGEVPANRERLECILHLPFGGCVQLVGHVVRTAAAPDGTRVAVQIERYWIRPRKDDDPPATEQADPLEGKLAGLAAGTAAPAEGGRLQTTAKTTAKRAERKLPPRGESE